MAEAVSELQAGRQRQKLRSEVVHGWYQFVLAYPDHLIADLLMRLGVGRGALVLDPFCGTGTTLVECKKLGIDSIGIDANPASVVASQVKTDWDLDPELVEELSRHLVAKVAPLSQALLIGDMPLFSNRSDLASLRAHILAQSPEGQYVVQSGMISRHWIDETPFLISVALLTEIKELRVDVRYTLLLKLALVSCIVESIANVRFGPEIYVVKGSGNHDVLRAFTAKVSTIADDLRTVSAMPEVGRNWVLEGDSRQCDVLLREAGFEQVDCVITSPPYPTEKDYTRNTRLELVYLGFVHDRESLRRIKGRMVRSHSKGIYKEDSDGKLVADLPYIKALADELRRKTAGKKYGFAKLYPRIIEEYFGGMYRHLLSLSQVLRPGGKAAYVVGEQCTYLQTFTPTGTILAQLAERPEVGFRVSDVMVWRIRQGTTGSGNAIKEEIVVIEKK
ncbi:MAG: site-specific DNA-methyltransferase [Anaerolineae bacterium]|nr:site-specific DNA-methyltransferase [Anaerolineae bacterium]